MRTPRQSGLISIWFSTLLYALGLAGVSLPVIGSLLVLFTAERVQSAIAKRDPLGSMWAAPSLMFYLALLWANEHIIILILLFSMLFLAMIPATKEKKEVTHWSTIVGGALISLHSTAYLLFNKISDVRAFLPIIYSMTATSQASLRVLGERRSVRMLFVLLLLIQSALGLMMSGWWLLLVVDGLSRVFQPVMSVKAYGMTELARMSIVLILLSLLG